MRRRVVKLLTIEGRKSCYSLKILAGARAIFQNGEQIGKAVETQNCRIPVQTMAQRIVRGRFSNFYSKLPFRF